MRFLLYQQVAAQVRCIYQRTTDYNFFKMFTSKDFLLQIIDYVASQRCCIFLPISILMLSHDTWFTTEHIQIVCSTESQKCSLSDVTISYCIILHIQNQSSEDKTDVELPQTQSLQITTSSGPHYKQLPEQEWTSWNR